MAENVEMFGCVWRIVCFFRRRKRGILANFRNHSRILCFQKMLKVFLRSFVGSFFLVVAGCISRVVVWRFCCWPVWLGPLRGLVSALHRILCVFAFYWWRTGIIRDLFGLFFFHSFHTNITYNNVGKPTVSPTTPSLMCASCSTANAVERKANKPCDCMRIYTSHTIFLLLSEETSAETLEKTLEETLEEVSAETSAETSATILGTIFVSDRGIARGLCRGFCGPYPNICMRVI